MANDYLNALIIFATFPTYVHMYMGADMSLLPSSITDCVGGVSDESSERKEAQGESTG